MPFLQKRMGTAPKSFGEALRELRELRGYTVEALARATGIHPTIIAALEAERLEELLDAQYAERHVRTLLAELEGQPVHFLEKYHALLKTRGLAHAPDVLLRPRVRMRDLLVGPRIVAVAGFLLFVAVIAGYVIWQARLVASMPALVVTSPIDGTRLDLPHVEVAGRTDPTSFVAVNGRQAVVDSTGGFSLSVDVPPGLTTLHIEAHRRFGSSAVIERHVIYEREATTSTQ